MLVENWFFPFLASDSQSTGHWLVRTPNGESPLAPHFLCGPGLSASHAMALSEHLQLD